MFIIFISFFSLKVRNISVFGIEISYTDVLLVLIFIFLFPLFFKKMPSTSSANWSIKFLYFILIYAFITTLWASYPVSYWYVFYQLMLAFLTVSIPYLMSKITNDKHINYHTLISDFSTVLAFIFFVYILNIQPNIRLNGNLGGAAIISVIMIPVLAVHFHNILHKRRIILSSICFFISLMGIFFTESRAGLAMLLLYVLVTLFRKPNLKRILVMSALAIIFVVVFIQKISTERYNEAFTDIARSTMLESAIAWGTSSTASFMFGNGYGSIWIWHAFEKGALPWWHYPFQTSEHGILMFHAHSIFNQLFAELGLVGLILFALFIITLFKETFISWRNKNELKTNILVSIICTLPTLHTDLMFFRNWEVSIIWLFYLFTALKYPAKPIIES